MRNSPVKNKQSGAALLLVILLVSLLTIAVLEFQREAYVELRSAATFRDSVKAHALLRSGVTAAIVLLKRDLIDDKDNHRTADSLDEPWAQLYPLPPFEDGSMISLNPIVDLDGRFPLNSVIDGAQKRINQQQMDRFKRLLENLEFENVNPEDLAKSLEEWIDVGGNGPFYIEHTDMLKSIEGFGQAIEWRGEPTTVAAAVSSYVDVRRDPRINLNTAPPEVVKCLDANLNDGDVSEIMSNLPALGLHDATGKPPMNNPIFRRANWGAILKVEGIRFLADIAVDVNGVQRKAKAVLVRDRNDQKVNVESWREE